MDIVKKKAYMGLSRTSGGDPLCEKSVQMRNLSFPHERG